MSGARPKTRVAGGAILDPQQQTVQRKLSEAAQRKLSEAAQRKLSEAAQRKLRKAAQRKIRKPAQRKLRKPAQRKLQEAEADLTKNLKDAQCEEAEITAQLEDAQSEFLEALEAKAELTAQLEQAAQQQAAQQQAAQQQAAQQQAAQQQTAQQQDAQQQAAQQQAAQQQDAQQQDAQQESRKAEADLTPNRKGMREIVDTYAGFMCNPLTYASNMHTDYVNKYLGPKNIVFGMTPGFYGMAQNGLPFGYEHCVRDWMETQGDPVGSYPDQHPKHPILGLDCKGPGPYGMAQNGDAQRKLSKAAQRKLRKAAQRKLRKAAQRQEAEADLTKNLKDAQCEEAEITAQLEFTPSKAEEDHLS